MEHSTVPLAPRWRVRPVAEPYPEIEDAAGQLVAMVVAEPIRRTAEAAQHATYLAAAPELAARLLALAKLVLRGGGPAATAGAWLALAYLDELEDVCAS